MKQNLSRKDLENLIGRRARVSEVLTGKRSLTLEMLARDGIGSSECCQGWKGEGNPSHVVFPPIGRVTQNHVCTNRSWRIEKLIVILHSSERLQICAMNSVSLSADRKRLERHFLAAPGLLV
jgi:hypothetical protein